MVKEYGQDMTPQEKAEIIKSHLSAEIARNSVAVDRCLQWIGNRRRIGYPTDLLENVVSRLKNNTYSLEKFIELEDTALGLMEKEAYQETQASAWRNEYLKASDTIARLRDDLQEAQTELDAKRSIILDDDEFIRYVAERFSEMADTDDPVELREISRSLYEQGVTDISTNLSLVAMLLRGQVMMIDQSEGRVFPHDGKYDHHRGCNCQGCKPISSKPAPDESFVCNCQGKVYCCDNHVQPSMEEQVAQIHREIEALWESVGGR